VDWLKPREDKRVTAGVAVVAIVIFGGMVALSYFAPTPREEPMLRAIVASVPMPHEPSSCRAYAKQVAVSYCLFHVMSGMAANRPQALDPLEKQGWKVVESNPWRAALCKSNMSLTIESIGAAEKGEMTVRASLIPFFPTRDVWHVLSAGERKCLELIGVSPR
jgi:hypothetical protein